MSKGKGMAGDKEENAGLKTKKSPKGKRGAKRACK
jgi:hypothetical protein